MAEAGQQNILSGLITEINSALTIIQRSGARLIRSKAEISLVRDLTQSYFRIVRPVVLAGGLDIELLDSCFSRLLELSNLTSLRSSYIESLRLAKKRATELEIQNEFSFSNNSPQRRGPSISGRSSQEEAIIDTLQRTNIHFANAYTQILIDLEDEDRLSYRGVVHEIRELLRGVLNHFAPDEDVQAQTNYKNEPGQNKPTRTQKMKFILDSRNQSSAQIEPASKTTRYLDVQTEILSAIPTAIYGAGSDSAHADPRDLRTEVVRLKRYLDANLCDILEIS